MFKSSLTRCSPQLLTLGTYSNDSVEPVIRNCTTVKCESSEPPVEIKSVRQSVGEFRGTLRQWTLHNVAGQHLIIWHWNEATSSFYYSVFSMHVS